MGKRPFNKRGGIGIPAILGRPERMGREVPGWHAGHVSEKRHGYSFPGSQK